MSLEPSSLRSLLERRIIVSPFIRVFLALTVIVGGLAFSALGTLFFFAKPVTPYPSPVGVAFLSVAMVAAGIGFLWVGMQLIRARAAMSNVLSPAARRRCSLIVGSMAVCLLIAAVQARSSLLLTVAASLIVFSYFLFPLSEH